MRGGEEGDAIVGALAGRLHTVLGAPLTACLRLLLFSPCDARSVVLFFAQIGAGCAASEGAVGQPRFRLESETREDEAIHRGRGRDGVGESVEVERLDA